MPVRQKIVSHWARKTREALVSNLQAQIEANYRGLSITAAYEKIEAGTGISLSSMQRIMSGNTGPSIDTLADLAHHLGTTVADLLTVRKEGFLPAPHGQTAGVAAQRLQRGR